VTLSVWLPWPAAALSPNSRSHWSVKALAVKNARYDAKVLTLDAMQGLHLYLPEDILIRVTFVPSKKRQGYDHDNAQASLKAACDGIADALSVDDKRFRYEYIHEAWQAEAGVYFEIGDYPMDENERIAQSIIHSIDCLTRAPIRRAHVVDRVAAALAQARLEGANQEARTWAGFILDGDAFTIDEISKRVTMAREDFSADDAATLVNNLVVDLKQARDALKNWREGTYARTDNVTVKP